jgi:hypothetical protein
LVCPAHDYQRRLSRSRGKKKRNPRLGGEKTLEEFKDIMARLNLPPKFIDYAVPGISNVASVPRPARELGNCTMNDPEPAGLTCR